MYPRYILEASTRCGLHAKPRRASATEARRRRGHSVYGESDIHRDGAVERLNASSALPKKGEWWLRLSKSAPSRGEQLARQEMQARADAGLIF